MATQYRWVVPCRTENVLVYVNTGSSTVAPTACPNDAAHAIGNDISVMEAVAGGALAAGVVKADADGAMVSVPEATGFNLALGTAAGTVAEGNHGHAAADVTSGTFANARVAVGNVTQHQTSITALGTQAAALDMGGTNKIVSLADPTAAQDAATKAYVDARAPEQYQASQQVSSSTATGYASSTFALVGGMTVTPAASGTYLCIFSCAFTHSTASMTSTWAIFNDGASAADTERVISTSGGQNQCLVIQSAEVVVGGTPVTVRHKCSAGTVTPKARTLTLVRVA